jgi:hypothetical protein
LHLSSTDLRGQLVFLSIVFLLIKWNSNYNHTLTCIAIFETLKLTIPFTEASSISTWFTNAKQPMACNPATCNTYAAVICVLASCRVYEIFLISLNLASLSSFADFFYQMNILLQWNCSLSSLIFLKKWIIYFFLL